MLISSLAYLIGAKTLQSAPMQAIDGFGAQKNKAYFASCEASATHAAKEGAYVIICAFTPSYFEAETYYLKVASLENAMLVLMKYKVDEAKLLILDKTNPIFAPAFGIKVLDSSLKEDFARLVLAKQGDIFFANSNKYQASFSSNITCFKNNYYIICKRDFSCELCIDKEYFLLNLPSDFAPDFAKLICKLKASKHPFTYRSEKLRAIKFIFVNACNEIVGFGQSSRAFVLANKELFKYFSSNTKIKQAGLDFTYKNLSELKDYKDFHYALLDEDEGLLMDALNTKQKSNETCLF